MSANRINKEAVYDFLSDRQAKIASEKVAPLTDEISEMRDKLVEEALTKVGGLEKVANKFKEINEMTHEMTHEIAESLSYTYGSIADILRSAGRLSDPDSLRISIKNSIDDTVEIEQKKAYRDSVQYEIRDEFNKLREMVKRCSTGNQAVRNLKEIGFDVSSIKPATKQELVALKVNNDLLGLPEEKNE